MCEDGVGGWRKRDLAGLRSPDEVFSAYQSHPEVQSWASREAPGLAGPSDKHCHLTSGQGGERLACLDHIVSSSPHSLQSHFTDWGHRTKAL